MGKNSDQFLFPFLQAQVLLVEGYGCSAVKGVIQVKFKAWLAGADWFCTDNNETVGSHGRHKSLPVIDLAGIYATGLADMIFHLSLV